jgi:hypothetical protein
VLLIFSLMITSWSSAARSSQGGGRISSFSQANNSGSSKSENRKRTFDILLFLGDEEKMINRITTKPGLRSRKQVMNFSLPGKETASLHPGNLQE